MQITTSPAAQWATEGTEYPYQGGQKSTVWKAYQIVESNGAYAGRTVRFMTENGLVTAELRRANMSDGEGLVLILTGVIGDSAWHTIPQDSYVEVMA